MGTKKRRAEALQTHAKPRVAVFAPPLAERHKNPSLTARQSRCLFRIFGCVDLANAMGRAFALPKSYRLSLSPFDFPANPR